MKKEKKIIILSYEYDKKYSIPYFCKTIIDNELYYESGKSFEEAKKNLLKKITKSTPEIPPNETIEIIL